MPARAATYQNACSGILCDDGDICTDDICGGSGCDFIANGSCTCGNGTQEGGEECDDGNSDANDGCDLSCQRRGVLISIDEDQGNLVTIDPLTGTVVKAPRIGRLFGVEEQLAAVSPERRWLFPSEEFRTPRIGISDGTFFSTWVHPGTEPSQIAGLAFDVVDRRLLALLVLRGVDVNGTTDDYYGFGEIGIESGELTVLASLGLRYDDREFYLTAYDSIGHRLFALAEDEKVLLIVHTRTGVTTLISVSGRDGIPGTRCDFAGLFFDRTLGQLVGIADCRDVDPRVAVVGSIDLQTGAFTTLWDVSQPLHAHDIEPYAGAAIAAHDPDGRKIYVATAYDGSTIAEIDLADGAVAIRELSSTVPGYATIAEFGFLAFVPRVGERTSATATTPGSMVTTDGEGDGANLYDPIETTITTVEESAEITIVETAASGDMTGFTLLGQQVDITAPATTPMAPLTIEFELDAAYVPADLNTIEVFKDGVSVADCTGGAGIASPDPCVSSRLLLVNGNLRIRVLTSSASIWALGAPLACGNGLVEANEECDDSNLVDNDGCSQSCHIEYCGDGIPQAPREACDDGDDIDTDGCVSGCILAACGDGFVRDGVEECDDGNNADGDCCSSACLTESSQVVCRPALGECDEAELCAGSVCPEDQRKPPGYACIDDGNPCTVDECDGSNVVCPYAAGNQGTPCRAPVAECDEGELCDGSDTQCPAAVDSCPPTPTATETATVTPLPAATNTPAPRLVMSHGAGRPGGSACVQVSLDAASASINLLQQAITTESSDLSLSSCSLAASLASVPFEKTITVDNTGVGEATIAVNSPGAAYPLPSGILYSCVLQIGNLATPGESSIFSNASAVDTTAQAFSLVSQPGSITVTACDGDCNGSGEVTIGEVLACINHFLGRPLCEPSAERTACPIADANADSGVSIGEVSRCVNSFLSNCQ